MEEKYIESPEIISRVDSGAPKLIIQFGLVSVEKENITLMIGENGCYLSVAAEDLEYAATLSFFHPVVSAEAKATFEADYLTVEVPFKESLKDYMKVLVE